MGKIKTKRSDPAPRTQRDSGVAHEQTQIRGSLERIFALTTDFICVVGFDGYFKDINPAFEKLLGLSRHELLSTPFIKFVHPEDRSTTSDAFAGLLAGQNAVGFENRYQCEGGGWKWLSWNASSDLDGQMVYAIARDLTERRKAEDLLNREYSTLQGIIENTQASIFSVDRNYLYTNFNHQHAAIMQAIYGMEIKIGQSLMDCVTVAVDREIAKRNLDRALAGERFVESAYSGEDARSRLLFEVSYNLIRAEDGTVTGVSVFSNDITERKQAEAALREASSYNRRLIEASIDPLVTIGPDGRITDVNQGTEAVTGVARQQLIGDDFANYFTEPDKATAGYQKVLAEGWVRDYPLTIRHASGKTADVLYNATVYKTETGEVQGVFAAARDITERKQAEAALREASSYNRRLIEASIDPLVTIGPDGRITDVNQATELVTGVARQRLIGDDFANYFTEPDTANEGYQQVLAKGMVRDYPLTIRHASGKTTDVLYNATVYKTETGEVQGVFAAARDITERKQAEKALSLYAHRMVIINRLDHIISSSLDLGTVYDAFVVEMKEMVNFDRTAIILLDQAGENWQIIRQWTLGKPAFQSSSWFPLKGTAVEWIVQNQKTFLENRLGEKGEWSENPGLRQEGIQSRALLPLINQNKVIGSLTLASRQIDAYPADDLPLLQTLADQLAIAVQNSRLYNQARLTAEDLEVRVQARTTQLEQANKDLLSFSYSVSHDLRAPLRAINGFAQILARRHRENLDEEGRHFLDNVVEASNRMGVLIDDLLQYSRIGRASVHCQSVSLDELFAQILGDLGPRIAETNGAVHLPPPGSMRTIQSDATILSQIFTNIINNALTYYRPGVPPVIEVSFQVETDHFLFSIADNGIGIPKEFLEKIFNVFQRLHSSEEYPGTGIGLAIVKKSAELLNGRVWAESTEGAGSTFWIWIPKE